jgi:hypothetical protein
MHRATTLLVTCGVLFLAFGNPAKGITIRDDRSDSQYTALADSSYAYGGLIITHHASGNWLGSGSLISPSWVLTAGHVASGDSTITFDTTAGDVGVDRQIAYPTYGSGGPDIGLLHLSTPITTIQPVKLYSLAYGVDDHRDAVIVGAGNTGTGTSGQYPSGGTRRAAQTYVIANASDWGWGSDMILTQFRSPEGGAANLEGGGAQGDSGGGLILSVNGQSALAGEMSLAWWNEGSTVIGQYNTGGAYVRSAPLNDWILSYATDAKVIPEPSSLLLLTIGLGILGGMSILRRRNNGIPG